MNFKSYKKLPYIDELKRNLNIIHPTYTGHYYDFTISNDIDDGWTCIYTSVDRKYKSLNDRIEQKRKYHDDKFKKELIQAYISLYYAPNNQGYIDAKEEFDSMNF
jgi:hypothetical protein